MLRKLFLLDVRVGQKSGEKMKIGCLVLHDKLKIGVTIFINWIDLYKQKDREIG